MPSIVATGAPPDGGTSVCGGGGSFDGGGALVLRTTFCTGCAIGLGESLTGSALPRTAAAG
jgi:hypothetical protein